MTHQTTAGIEIATALLLGAGEDDARAAVAAIEAAGMLDVGIALPALLVAARKGTDAAGAVARLAAGERVPASWSDFEHRAATVEAAEEGEAARRRLRRGSGRVEAVGADAPVVAARAVLAGVAVVSVPADAPERSWIGRLADAADVAVETLEASPDGVAGAAVVTTRRGAHLDPFLVG